MPRNENLKATCYEQSNGVYVAGHHMAARIFAKNRTTMNLSIHRQKHTGKFILAQRNATHGRAKKTSLSFWKFGVPSPVTGSQPGVALNPLVPQPGLLPMVISLNASGLL